MVNRTRREFIRNSLLATGMAGIPGPLASVIANAQEISANTVKGSIQDVEHVVILMLENRSLASSSVTWSSNSSRRVL